jgi:outer membrane protein assembly factor BamA
MVIYTLNGRMEESCLSTCTSSSSNLKVEFKLNINTMGVCHPLNDIQFLGNKESKQKIKRHFQKMTKHGKVHYVNESQL